MSIFQKRSLKMKLLIKLIYISIETSHKFWCKTHSYLVSYICCLGWRKRIKEIDQESLNRFNNSITHLIFSTFYFMLMLYQSKLCFCIIMANCIYDMITLNLAFGCIGIKLWILTPTVCLVWVVVRILIFF